jgi:K+-transporting ATPase KdpF subunit
MNFESVIVIVVSILVGIYLTYAMLRPEKF